VRERCNDEEGRMPFEIPTTKPWPEPYTPKLIEPLSEAEEDCFELEAQLRGIAEREKREFEKSQAVLRRDRLRKQIEAKGEKPCR
jgi:hypothetical protein